MDKQPAPGNPGLKPITDVAPPTPPGSTLAQPPAAEQPTARTPATTTPQPALPPAPLSAKPKVEHQSTPAVAVILVVILFVVLAALAYYAYSRSN